ncbi:hypothetical protein O181_035507 [Austropuccinia psidii MF-1]|uniref:Uncharacterized protein n=1 Tax=Austropuccinia psidii MF-1 TaxID=1389203 RepID=A0A9Q3H922_9BASI|nr:hypothetical protein [Austropuccinia psidii MF-1]
MACDQCCNSHQSCSFVKGQGGQAGLPPSHGQQYRPNKEPSDDSFVSPDDKTIQKEKWMPRPHSGFNPPQSHIVSEPSLTKNKKTTEVLSINSSTSPSKHTRTTSPVNFEPVPGTSKTQKTPPPAYGPSVSFEPKKMDTNSLNHEDNNSANDLYHKNSKASHHTTPKVSKEEVKSFSSSMPAHIKSSQNPIPEPSPLKAEPCGTFQSQQDPILNRDSNVNKGISK